MFDFTYRATNDRWGTEAECEGSVLTFSGSFEKKRIQEEQVRRTFMAAQKIALWIAAGLGTAALIYAAYQSSLSRDYVFMLRHSPEMLLFWLSCLAGMYLWALYKQEDLIAAGRNMRARTQSGARTDIYELFNDEAKIAWARAFSIAQSRGSATVGGSDLLLGLLEHSQIQLVFARLGVNFRSVQTILENHSRLSKETPTGSLQHVPFVAYAESVKLHNTCIDPLMLLCALTLELPEDHVVQAIFFNLGVLPVTLEIIASWVFTIRIMADELRLFRKLAKFKSGSEINQGLTATPTVYLDRFSRDLTRDAKYGRLPIALGRQNDLAEIFKMVNGQLQSIVIKGAEGAGRTTLVHELAYKMVTEQVPEAWQDKRLVKLESSAIVGTHQRAEEALMQALNEATRDGNIILVIEDIHSLGRAQSTEGLSLLELLVDFLEHSPLTVIATTTGGDYTDVLHGTPNFDQVFTGYELQELSPTDILLACCIRASILENQNKCFFQYAAIQQAVNLTNQYVKGSSQPQKAIAVLVQAATKSAHSSGIHVVSDHDIESLISTQTHIPTHTFTENEAEKLLNLETTIGKSMVGQQEAVVAVSEGLRRARSGLGSTTRPLASFLFLGPTGVGKTELAKTLASVYFGEEKYLLRLDMSEYRGSDGLEKMLGKQGDRGDTALVKHLKNYPFCLLLLDEFEKASSEILNIFLQILEDGRLTSGRGETLDLTHTLIIATSNAGTRDIQEGVRAGKTKDQIKTALFNGPLLQLFAPELLNRFDGVIIFNPLTQTEIEQITYLQLEYLRKQLRDRGIELEFTKAVLEDIGKNAFDPTLGARPIRRYIQDHVEGFVAKLLLSKKLERGSKVTVDLKDGSLILA